MTAWIAQGLLSIAVITHLLDRTSFGPTPADIERVQAIGVERYIDEQVHPERLPDAGLEPRLRDTATLPEQKVVRAIYSTRQLQEVLVDFWFNHFNIDVRKG